MIEPVTAYSVLIEIIVGICCSIIGIFIFLHLFIKNVLKTFTKIAGISPSMMLYIIYEILSALSFLIYWVYLGITWNGINTWTDNIALFVSGAPQSGFLITRPVVVFFLGLDRILCTRVFLRYQGSIRSVPVIFALTSSVTMVSYLYGTGIYYAPPPGVSQCMSIGCNMDIRTALYYAYIREGCSAANVIVGLILFIEIRRKSMINKFKNNRIVLFTLGITILLDLFPHALSALASSIGTQTQLYGPYTPCLASIEITLCALLYWKNWKKQSSNVPAIIVGAQ